MMFINIVTDDEMWRPIFDENIEDIYEVSDHGRIRNKNTGYIIKQIFANDNYMRVNLQSKSGNKNNVARRVSRLVLKAFNPLDDSSEFQVNHKDGNHLNNRLDNLEWVTGKENIEHARINRLYDNLLRGDAHPKSKYKEVDTKRACILLSKGFSILEIIEMLGFENTRKNREYIRRVRERKVHTHISKDYVFPSHESERQPFTDEIVHKICRMLDDEKNYAYILNQLDLPNNPNNISRLSGISRGETFTEISNQYNFAKKPMYERRSDEYVEKICKLLDKGLSTSTIISILNSPNTQSEKQFIRAVKRGEAFRRISEKYNFMKTE